MSQNQIGEPGHSTKKATRSYLDNLREASARITMNRFIVMPIDTSWFEDSFAIIPCLQGTFAVLPTSEVASFIDAVFDKRFGGFDSTKKLHIDLRSWLFGSTCELVTIEPGDSVLPGVHKRYAAGYDNLRLLVQKCYMDSENVALFGCSEATIDAEGRVGLPDNLSCALGSEPIMLSSLTGDSVWLMPDEPALRAYIDKLFEDKFGGFNPENSEHARLERALMGGAWHTSLEADGSLLIPQELAERVALGEDVAVIGVGDHVEIMASKVWEEICSAIAYLKRII